MLYTFSTGAICSWLKMIVIDLIHQKIKQDLETEWRMNLYTQHLNKAVFSPPLTSEKKLIWAWNEWKDFTLEV